VEQRHGIPGFLASKLTEKTTAMRLK